LGQKVIIFKEIMYFFLSEEVFQNTYYFNQIFNLHDHLTVLITTEKYVMKSCVLICQAYYYCKQ